MASARCPQGGGAGLGLDRFLSDLAARWRALGPGAGPAGGVGGRTPATRVSRAKGPGLAGTRMARDAGLADRDAGGPLAEWLLGGASRWQRLALGY